MKEIIDRDILFESIAANIPKGFAYFKIILNSKDEPVDCITLGMNAEFRSIFSYNESIVGKPLSESIEITETTILWLRRFGKIAEEGGTDTFEYQLPDSKMWYSVTGFSFQKGYYAIVIDDITNIKNLSIENQQHKEEFEMIFNGTQDAIFVLDVFDEHILKFKRLNKSHEISTGLTTELVKGKTPFELLGNKVGKEVYDKYMICVNSKAPISYEESLTLLTGTKTWMTTLSPVIHNNKVIQIIGSARDITDRIIAVNQLSLEKERISITLKSINDGVITTDLKGVITYANESALSILGVEENELLGKYFDDLVIISDKKNRNMLKVYLLKILNLDLSIERFNNMQLETSDTGSKLIVYKRAPILSADNIANGVVISISDETKNIENEKKLVFLSMHDGLTGLYNREYFDEEVKRLDTKRQLPLSMIIGDVNGLKITNDVFGHLSGDQLLKEVSKIFKKVLRSEDIIARWGGDEFVALLPNTSKIDAQVICNRIKLQCELTEDTPIKPSISLGIGTKIHEHQSIVDVFNLAEAQMYKNKLFESKLNRAQIIGSLKSRLKELNLETIEHCNRIKEMVVRYASKLNISENEKDLLIILADIHDIGNISVKANILSKPGKLDEAEWLEVKKHPEIGYRIAQANADLVVVSEYILTHHENWDGSGYPQGLSGTKIPKLSRILRLFDAYDVMTHDKPYKIARTQAEAFEEILKCTGTQFDPKYAEMFINAIKFEKEDFYESK